MITDLMITFWQPVVVGVLIIIGFLISKFDGQGENRVGFEYMEMPVMKPIKICTADKGFWKAIKGSLLDAELISLRPEGRCPLRTS